MSVNMLIQINYNHKWTKTIFLYMVNYVLLK